ncbi:MAG: hydrolase [Chlorobium sp.]|nr:MAG: hydrolase [Chlorobium sp.]
MEPLFDKSSTALVIIDLQNGITVIPSLPYDAGNVIASAAKLADAFRCNGMPVFLVRVAASADGKDRLVPLTDNAGSPATIPLTPGWSDIVPELGPREHDQVITKKQWGAFYGTELDLQLRRRKMDTIVLCGISTNIGVESTARFAFEYGYQQIFAEDAMSARSVKEHEYTVSVIFPRIGRVRKTSDILEQMKKQ